MIFKELNFQGKRAGMPQSEMRHAAKTFPFTCASGDSLDSLLSVYVMGSTLAQTDAKWL